MSAPSTYDAQHRGTAGAYEAYHAGMDRTMRQKLAFVGAHFLLDPRARIADMGCGSGSGTHQLALLNPSIEVIGVDINPESVRYATDKYRLPNLRFVVGDTAEPVFAEDPLDGILSSSTLHRVYTFNGYSRAAVIGLPIVHTDEVLIGLETRLLPVPQLHEGNARILTAPAWRLDRQVETMDQAKSVLAAHFGVAAGSITPLGAAAYFPSAGLTPERVYPFIVRLSETSVNTSYDYVPLMQMKGNLHRLRDGHLLIAVMRLVHALGLWD